MFDLRDFGRNLHLNSYDKYKDSIPGIDMRNVSFEYRRNANILNRFNLQIPKGKIFALLGPSGCGKTTVIRMILGRLKLTSGSIEVFGVRPGAKNSDIPGNGVGYMPQELALFEEFSISDILTYYANLCDLNSNDMYERITELLKVLDLPQTSRPISQLSGGQKRRVSFAIALIHKPKLLLLDEPTVGVDSLLRYRIWSYLETLCKKNGQTIILTTHYIEEAKSAANVALMGFGTVLRQENPQKLLSEYQCNTLEEVFLTLYKDRNANHKFEAIYERDVENDFNPKVVIDSKENVFKTKSNNKRIHFRHIKARLWKSYEMVKKKPLFLIIFQFLPLLGLATMHVIVGKRAQNIPLAVYNADENPIISQQFIDLIDKNFTQLNIYNDNKTAIDSVVSGLNPMLIVFNEEYSDAFEARFTYLFNANDENLYNSEIKVYVDLTNAQIVMLLFQEMFTTFTKLFDILSPKFGFDLKGYVSAFRIEEVIYNEMNVNLYETQAPGHMVLMMYALSLVISSHLICIEKKNSSLERELVAGVKPIEIYITHIIQNCLFVITLAFNYMFIAFILYDTKQLGSYLEVYILLFTQGLLGISTGMTIALILTESINVAVGATLFFWPVWFISGDLWPLEAIPEYFRFISAFGPLTNSMSAIRSIVIRGWNYTRPTVYYAYIYNIVQTFILNLFNIYLINKY